MVTVTLFVCVNVAQVSSLTVLESELVHFNQVVVRGGHRRLMQYIDCDGLCKVRCSLHSRPNVCTRACGTCCRRCKCVPPGTSGNKGKCGSCYTDMKTHGNKPKCP
ncbi:gibberellin-regulated protein 11-like [Telopea speciosissima]|uniref:gibberellin-regulated protein 11-like n=1 Tax=Telopea speciosissima TaxID=54955 RepID=UPI001CC75453|nr:gibberellin-regulated protein 11-like [Telopea speciosissima]